jgi:hypothetical protein
MAHKYQFNQKEFFIYISTKKKPEEENSSVG